MTEALRMDKYSDNEQRILTVIWEDANLENEIVYRDYWREKCQSILENIEKKLDNDNYDHAVDIYRFLPRFINGLKDEISLRIGKNDFTIIDQTGEIEIIDDREKDFEQFINAVIDKIKKQLIMGKGKKYRYPGINFFTKDDQDVFCGRADDTQRLFSRVMLNNTMVLHGESGSGKSSLVQAGLIPLLEKQNEYLLSQHKPQYLTVTVRLDSISKISDEGNVNATAGVDILVSKIMNCLNELSDYKAKELPFISSKENSFWYTAKLFERNNYTLLLILDQFEELQGYSSTETEAFTKKLSEFFVTPMPEAIYDEYDNKTVELFNVKGMTDENRKVYNENIKFIEQPLNVRILFVVREDKLGTMSLLSDYFPNILKNDFFLLPLNEKGARSAIVEPAQKEGNFQYERFSFDEGAIADLLHNLVDSNGLYDPIQLQIVCSNIERKISINKKLIKKDDIPPVRDIIRDFYLESWEGIQKEFKLSTNDYEKRRRIIIENLVVSNSRNLVLEKLLIIDSNQLDENIIKSLVKDGLLRKIPTGKDTFYQLNHDRLMSPLNDDLLELKVKEKEKVSKQQREQELTKTRKRLRIVYSLLGAALLALITAIYFWITAINARIAADNEKNAAESAKISAINAKKEKEELSKTLIGAKYQGGIVFYWSDKTGKHGLIAAEKDLDSIYTWDQALKKCNDYSLTFNAVKYDDWRLPKIEELAALYANRVIVGGFAGDYYWSQSVSNIEGNAWGQLFDSSQSSGLQKAKFKSRLYHVRAVRKFNN